VLWGPQTKRCKQLSSVTASCGFRSEASRRGGDSPGNRQQERAIVKWGCFCEFSPWNENLTVKKYMNIVIYLWQIMKTVKFISEETDDPPLKGLSTRILRHLFMGLTKGFRLYPILTCPYLNELSWLPSPWGFTWSKNGGMPGCPVIQGGSQEVREAKTAKNCNILETIKNIYANYGWFINSLIKFVPAKCDNPTFSFL